MHGIPVVHEMNLPAIVFPGTVFVVIQPVSNVKNCQPKFNFLFDGEFTLR